MCGNRADMMFRVLSFVLRHDLAFKEKRPRRKQTIFPELPLNTWYNKQHTFTGSVGVLNNVNKGNLTQTIKLQNLFFFLCAKKICTVTV